MKRMGSSSSKSTVPGGRKAGRPFGETSYSGKKLMTKYTKPSGSGNNMTFKAHGKAASSNGAKNLNGRASGKTYVHDPNIRSKPN